MKLWQRVREFLLCISLGLVLGAWSASLCIMADEWFCRRIEESIQTVCQSVFCCRTRCTLSSWDLLRGQMSITALQIKPIHGSGWKWGCERIVCTLSWWDTILSGKACCALLIHKPFVQLTHAALPSWMEHVRSLLAPSRLPFEWLITRVAVNHGSCAYRNDERKLSLEAALSLDSVDLRLEKRLRLALHNGLLRLDQTPLITLSPAALFIDSKNGQWQIEGQARLLHAPPGQRDIEIQASGAQRTLSCALMQGRETLCEGGWTLNEGGSGSCAFPLSLLQGLIPSLAQISIEGSVKGTFASDRAGVCQARLFLTQCALPLYTVPDACIDATYVAGAWHADMVCSDTSEPLLTARGLVGQASVGSWEVYSAALKKRRFLERASGCGMFSWNGRGLGLLHAQLFTDEATHAEAAATCIIRDGAYSCYGAHGLLEGWLTGLCSRQRPIDQVRVGTAQEVYLQGAVDKEDILRGQITPEGVSSFLRLAGCVSEGSSLSFEGRVSEQGIRGGTWRLTEGVLRHPALYTVIKSGAGSYECDLQKRILRVPHALFEADRGTVTVEEASVSFDGSGGGLIGTLPLKAHNIVLKWGRDLFADVSAALVGTFSVAHGARLHGTVAINAAELRPTFLRSCGALPPSADVVPDPECENQWHVAVCMRSPATLSNAYLTLLFGGDGYIKGPFKKPRFVGTLYTLEGSVHCPYKPLFVTEGSLVFKDGGSTWLKLIARTVAKRCTVTLSIDGPLQAPAVSLTSTPERTPEQLIRLLWGGAEDALVAVPLTAGTTEEIVSQLLGDYYPTATSWVARLLWPTNGVRIFPSLTQAPDGKGMQGIVTVEYADSVRVRLCKRFSTPDALACDVEYLLSDDASVGFFRDAGGEVGVALEVRVGR
jgi:hypothetical protein